MLWTWYRLPWRRYAQFEGRATRTEYWVFTLGNTAIQLVGMLVVNLSHLVALSFLLLLWNLALILPNLAVLVRRLHDTNRSGWWVWIGLIPLVGIILLTIWTVLVSTPGPNRFGDPDDLSATTEPL